MLGKTHIVLSIFDTGIQVLSKSHAAFSFQDGKFYLKDTGSCNGTFLNNLRLSRAGEESEMTQVYSQDIIRQVGLHSKAGEESERTQIETINSYIFSGTAGITCRIKTEIQRKQLPFFTFNFNFHIQILPHLVQYCKLLILI